MITLLEPSPTVTTSDSLQVITVEDYYFIRRLIDNGHVNNIGSTRTVEIPIVYRRPLEVTVYSSQADAFNVRIRSASGSDVAVSWEILFASLFIMTGISL